MPFLSTSAYSMQQSQQCHSLSRVAADHTARDLFWPDKPLAVCRHFDPPVRRSRRRCLTVQSEKSARRLSFERHRDAGATTSQGSLQFAPVDASVLPQLTQNTCRFNSPIVAVFSKSCHRRCTADVVACSAVRYRCRRLKLSLSGAPAMNWSVIPQCRPFC